MAVVAIMDIAMRAKSTREINLAIAGHQVKEPHYKEDKKRNWV